VILIDMKGSGSISKLSVIYLYRIVGRYSLKELQNADIPVTARLLM
jgi:hypothetical protein